MAISTSGIMNPAEVVNHVMDVALSKALEASSKAEYAFDAAKLGLGLDPSHMAAANLPVGVPDIHGIEPKVFIPEVAEGASMELFNSWWQQINDSLQDKMDWFIGKYFPNECKYLQKAQLWICKVLTEGGTGINPHVEDQIWQRDRRRALTDASRQEQEVVEGFAAKGFPLPPGAMMASLERIRRDSYDKIAEASRTTAEWQAKTEIENIRFAVTSAIDLYTKMMNCVMDFMKALITSSGQMAQLIPSVTDSQSRLIGAAAEYYRARLSAQELLLKAATTNAEFKQQANKSDADSYMKAMELRLQAAIEAARSFATQASAALNALHASAAISGSGNNSVSYSYSNDTSGSPPAKTVA